MINLGQNLGLETLPIARRSYAKLWPRAGYNWDVFLPNLSETFHRFSTNFSGTFAKLFNDFWQTWAKRSAKVGEVDENSVKGFVQGSSFSKFYENFAQV